MKESGSFLRQNGQRLSVGGFGGDSDGLRARSFGMDSMSSGHSKESLGSDECSGSKSGFWNFVTGLGWFEEVVRNELIPETSKSGGIRKPLVEAVDAGVD